MSLTLSFIIVRVRFITSDIWKIIENMEQSKGI